MITQARCEDRIQKSLEGRMNVLKRLMECNDPTEYVYDEDGVELGCFEYYHLEFVYVEPMTYDKQPFGYWRYLISTGGPHDEIRYITGSDGNVVEMQYWFLDWFDGACIVLEGEYERIAQRIYDYFIHCL